MEGGALVWVGDGTAVDDGSRFEPCVFTLDFGYFGAKLEFPIDCSLQGGGQEHVSLGELVVGGLPVGGGQLFLVYIKHL
jgi:hypothetical protein